jgi:cystathionine beta-lyase/cystathionine gamma-synthase
LLDKDAHVLAGNDVYGGTFRLFDKVLRRFGPEFDFIDTTDPESVAEALTPRTRLVWLETPTNPYLRVTDIRAVAEAVHAHSKQALLVVDNTRPPPQQPLDLGADIVIHSTTKHLGAYSDVVEARLSSGRRAA